MNEIDELCEAFASSTSTTDEGEEIDILNDMIENLYKLKDSKGLRDYLNKVSFHMNRYYHSFISDILRNNRDFNFIHEIKVSSEKFLDMWVIFTKNEKLSTPNDLEILRNLSLDCFSWILKSVEEFNERQEDPDPYGDLEQYDEVYDPKDFTEGMEI